MNPLTHNLAEERAPKKAAKASTEMPQQQLELSSLRRRPKNKAYLKSPYIYTHTHTQIQTNKHCESCARQEASEGSQVKRKLQGIIGKGRQGKGREGKGDSNCQLATGAKEICINAT